MMNDNQDKTSNNNESKPIAKSGEEGLNPLTSVSISKPTPRLETASLHDDKNENRDNK